MRAVISPAINQPTQEHTHRCRLHSTMGLTPSATRHLPHTTGRRRGENSFFIGLWINNNNSKNDNSYDYKYNKNNEITDNNTNNNNDIINNNNKIYLDHHILRSALQLRLFLTLLSTYL